MDIKSNINYSNWSLRNNNHMIEFFHHLKREIWKTLSTSENNGVWGYTVCVCVLVKSLFRCDTHSKVIIQLICEQWVGQLSEVCLTEGTDTVNVLQIHLFIQVWRPLTVKLWPVPKKDTKSSNSNLEYSALKWRLSVNVNRHFMYTDLSFCVLDDTPDNL